jgi:hypothetical protein
MYVMRMYVYVCDEVCTCMYVMRMHVYVCNAYVCPTPKNKIHLEKICMSYQTRAYNSQPYSQTQVQEKKYALEMCACNIKARAYIAATFSDTRSKQKQKYAFDMCAWDIKTQAYITAFSDTGSKK